MIIFKCDICKRKTDYIDMNTIVLYKDTIDYCRYCKKEAERIKEIFEREIQCEYTILDSRLKAKESKIIKHIKNKNSGNFKLKEGETNG